MASCAPLGHDPRVSPQPLDPGHDRFCVIVGVEASFCFLVPFVFLTVGAAYLPILVVGAVMHPHDIWAWKAVAQVMLGSAGIAGVGRAVSLIWTKARDDRWRWLTLLGLACGAAVAVEHWVAVSHGRVPGGLEVLIPIVYVPLACAAHLVYLARRPLFSRRATAHSA
jgi:hypothetical protein